MKSYFIISLNWLNYKLFPYLPFMPQHYYGNKIHGEFCWGVTKIEKGENEFLSAMPYV